MADPIDPVFSDVSDGYTLSGRAFQGWQSGGIGEPSSTAASATEFLEIYQTLDFEYVRKGVYQWFNAPSSVSLSGSNTLEYVWGGLSRTELWCKGNATVTLGRITAGYSGTYVQPQKFQLYPIAADAYGNSYGSLSAVSGFAMGPRGSVITSQPYYARYFWSAVSGMSEYSGVGCTLENESREFYTKYPSVSGTYKGDTSGPPTFGIGLETQAFSDPLQTHFDGMACNQVPMGPAQCGYPEGLWLGSVYGGYAASAENFQLVYNVIDGIANKLPSANYSATNSGGTTFTRIGGMINSQEYYSQLFQDAYGHQVYGDGYHPACVSVPTLTQYKQTRHDYS